MGREHEARRTCDIPPQRRPAGRLCRLGAAGKDYMPEARTHWRRTWLVAAGVAAVAVSGVAMARVLRPPERERHHAAGY
jgi:hypothetical protein